MIIGVLIVLGVTTWGVLAEEVTNEISEQVNTESLTQESGTLGGHLLFYPSKGVSYNNGYYTIEGTDISYYSVSNADSITTDRIKVSANASKNIYITLNNINIQNETNNIGANVGINNDSGKNLSITLQGENNITGENVISDNSLDCSVLSNGPVSINGNGTLNCTDTYGFMLYGNKLTILSGNINVKSQWAPFLTDINQQGGIIKAENTNSSYTNSAVNQSNSDSITTEGGMPVVLTGSLNISGGTFFGKVNSSSSFVPFMLPQKSGLNYPSNYSVLGIDNNGQYTVGSHLMLMPNASNYYAFADENNNFIKDIKISATKDMTNSNIEYSTQVQNVGWQTGVSDGEISGTEGKSLRLETIKIKLNDKLSGGVSYCTHVQNVGWQDWKNNNEPSGTVGQSLRLEAIQIKLTGSVANQYDIYYRVHAQNIGWMGWAKNGEQAGTAGYAYRLEAIQIELVKKGGSAPDASDSNTSEAFRHPMVQYQTHVQNIGWQGYVQDGAMSGTSGQSLRLEGIHINLSNQDYAGSIQYKTHVQNIGWQNWVSDGALSGTSGQSLRLEAIQIQLTGEMANHFDVYYRVHSQNIGWMGWAKNGEEAGTAGFAYRLEGIEIQLVQKDGAAPGSTDNHFVQR